MNILLSRAAGWLRSRFWLIAVTDVVVVGVFIYLIPWLRRPLEHLMLVLAGLAVATAAAAPRKWIQNAAVLVVSLSLAVFGLEMVQKIFNVFADVQEQQAMGMGEGSPYAWDATEPATYLPVKARAIADGVYDPKLLDRYAGDIFAGRDKAELWSLTSDRRRKLSVIQAPKPFVIEDSPLGYELAPDNVFREYALEGQSGEVLFDGKFTINRHGFRETRGNPGADSVYVFFGCSVTFGFGLSDDQTMPYYFSGRRGFADHVVNLAMNGYGTHNSLRDLELDHHMGRAGIDSGKVKAVFILFFDEHADRVVSPRRAASPRYAVENGVAVYQGTFDDAGRFMLMLERSRIYPEVKEKVIAAYGLDDKMEITMACLEKMHRICRERYGVPLTVVYRDGTPEIMERMRAAGMDIVLVNDILGEDWRTRAIALQLYDSHPNLEMNRLVGEYLADYVTKREQVIPVP